MAPATRSKVQENIFSFSENVLEKITSTLDPIQKTFNTTPAYLPFWRYALYQRYVGKFQPTGITGHWVNYGRLHKPYPVTAILDCNQVPSDLYQSTIELKTSPGNKKILKIHIYFTSCKILIQGRACTGWVDQEFEQLRAIVHTLAESSVNPEQLTLSDTHHPDICTALAILAPSDTYFQDDNCTMSPPSALSKQKQVLTSPVSKVIDTDICAVHISSPRRSASTGDLTNFHPSPDKCLSPSPIRVLDTPKSHLLHCPLPSVSGPPCPEHTSNTSSPSSSGDNDSEHVFATSSNPNPHCNFDQPLSNAVVSVSHISSQTDTSCIYSHENCVSIMEFERVKHDLKAEISALRSALRESRNHFNIELEALHTLLRHQTQVNTQISLSNPPSSSPHTTSKNHNKSKTPITPKPSPPSPSFPTPTSSIINATCQQQSPSVSDHSDHTENSPMTDDSKKEVKTNKEDEWPELSALRHNTATLILGDSVVTGLHQSKMAAGNEAAQVLSMSGMDRAGLVRLIKGTAPKHHVATVVIHVGVNDCKRGVCLGHGAWRSVLEAVKRCFPEAKLIMSSVLPYASSSQYIADCIRTSNNNLRTICEKRGVIFLDNNPAFSNGSGRAQYKLMKDAIHPNKMGTSVLAINIKRCFSSNSPINISTITPPGSSWREHRVKSDFHQQVQMSRNLPSHSLHRRIPQQRQTQYQLNQRAQHNIPQIVRNPLIVPQHQQHLHQVQHDDVRGPCPVSNNTNAFLTYEQQWPRLERSSMPCVGDARQTDPGKRPLSASDRDIMLQLLSRLVNAL